MKNESDAEDVAQEAFLNAFRNLAAFRGQAKFSTWLISITLNEARGRLRRQSLVRMESLDETPEEGGYVSPALLRDWREVPSEALERKEIREMLQEAIGCLAPFYREVVLLRDVEELSVEETATALTISVALSQDAAAPCSYHASEDTSATIKDCESKKEEVASMVIECKHVWDHISSYLDDSLPPETRELVQRHLEHCEICSAILDATRNILVLTADDRVFELPVGFRDRLHAR